MTITMTMIGGGGGVGGWITVDELGLVSGSDWIKSIR